MGNRAIKVISVSIISIILIPVVIILGLRLVFLPEEGISQRFPYYTTQFSNTMATSHYEKIKKGWSIETVENTIGKPFYYDSKNKFSLSDEPFVFTAQYTEIKEHFLINYASFMFLVHYDADSIAVSTTETWVYD